MPPIRRGSAKKKQLADAAQEVMNRFADRLPEPVCCRVRHAASLYFCTRPPGHDGDHIAGVGPYVEGEHILARWAQ